MLEKWGYALIMERVIHPQGGGVVSNSGAHVFDTVFTSR